MKRHLAITMLIGVVAGCGDTGPATQSPAATPAVSPSPTSARSTGMWPQTNADEVQAAQQRADAGDPDYTWQVDRQLAGGQGEEWDRWAEYLHDPGAQIVERFLRDELGWDASLFNTDATQGIRDNGGADGVITGLVYSRCAPGGKNPLYPSKQVEAARGAERCAPTIDDLRYETVSINLRQPGRRGPDGIWVVSGWHMTAPFAQADTRALQAVADARIRDFLQARIDGEGAEGRANTEFPVAEIPLLYATTTGARYERFEFERVGEVWPAGDLLYEVRLFADAGATVVDHPIEASPIPEYLWIKATLTTENGRPVPVRFRLMAGKLTVSAPPPWDLSRAEFDPPTLAKGNLGTRIQFLDDPHTVDAACEPDPPAATIEALADAIHSDLDFETTAPVRVNVAGLRGLSMDITATVGAMCPDTDRRKQVLTRERDGFWFGFYVGDGRRLRLYLLDAPEGSSMRILAIAIEVDDRFDDAEAMSIIETIEMPGEESASPRVGP